MDETIEKKTEKLEEEIEEAYSNEKDEDYIYNKGKLLDSYNEWMTL